jgi:hypothetical protein
MTGVTVETGALAINRKSCVGFNLVAWMLLLVPGALICGCSGVTSGNSAQANTSVPGSTTYAISGTLSPAVGGAGAAVTLGGAATGAVTADGSGNYIFSGLANGVYVVAPSHAGYSFSPGTQSVTVNGASVTGVNFTDAAQQTFTISGTISPTAGGSGATVSLSGAASATATTNASGNYTFPGLLSGTYTIIPSNAGFGFTPPSRNATISAASVTGMNFTATPQSTHSVSLSWGSSASAQVTGYNVYRSLVSGSLYARVNPVPVPGLSYTDLTVQNGITYYFVTTAVDANNNESIFSNEVPAQIP